MSYDPDDYQDRDRSLVKPKRAARYVELSTSAIISNALDEAIRSGDPSRVTGPSGIGKSAAIAELEADSRALSCEVGSPDASVRGMYKMLLRVYGLPAPSAGTESELATRVYNDIVGRYNDVEPLIIDEYQNIQPLALRELLRVQTRLGMPLVLVGNGETIVDRKRADQKRAMEQIENRFGMQVKIDDLLDSDYNAIASEWSVDRSDQVRAAVVEYGRRHSIHQLTMLLKAARQLSAIGTVRLEHLAAACALRNRDRLPIFEPAATPATRRKAS